MASSMPGAVNALLAMFDPTQGGALTGVQVSFNKAGPVYTGTNALQITEVRFIEDDIAELGPSYRHEEVYDIECQLTVYFGDAGFVQRLTDVMTIYNIIETTIANNPTLNGNVRVAIPQKTNYVPDQDANGNTVGNLHFVVNCAQRVNSLT